MATAREANHPEGGEPLLDSALDQPPPDAAEREGKRTVKRRELSAVVVMSITAILTAWTGFQATKWAGIQSSNYTQAGAARVDSSRASTEAGQRIMLDAVAYIAWAEALVDGNEAVATFARERFRDELAVAANAWIALDPLDNADVPPTPFDMPEYRVPAIERASELSEHSDELMAKATKAGDRSETYVLSTVFFAVVLFFAAMATKLDSPRNQQLMLSFSLAGMILGIGWILSLPMTI